MANFRRTTPTWKRRLYTALGSRRYCKPALDQLDDKLAQYLDHEGGFFIEAGANDGYSVSNTYYLEQCKQWRGLLVEPLPALAQLCQKERRRSAVVNAALVGPSYTDDTITLHYADLMSTVEGALKTADAQQEHLEKGVAVQQLEQSYAMQVPARTLASLLDDYAKHQSLPAIDFLSLDIEGYELEALKGLDLNRYQPRYILVEARFYEEISSYLKQWYEEVCQMTRHDYLYRLRVR